MGSNKLRVGATLVVMVLSALSRSYWRSVTFNHTADHQFAMYTGPSEQTATDYQKRALAALETNNLSGAIDALSEAIKCDPKQAALYFQRAMTYAIKNESDHALADATEGVRLEPGNGEGHYVRGLCLAHRKDFLNAIEEYSAALRLDWKNIDCYLHRGDACVETKAYTRALADFEEAIRRDPQNAEGYAGRALVFERKQEWTRAVADYAQAIRLAPEDPQAYNGLAWVYATCPSAEYRNGKMAVEYALYACRVTQSKEPEYVNTLAAAYAETGQFDEAVQWERKALESPSWKPSDMEKKRLGDRLAGYEKSRPFRDLGQ